MLIDGQEVATTTTSGPKPYTVVEIWIRDQGTENNENKTYQQILHERAAPVAKHTTMSSRLEAVDAAARANR